MVEGGGRGGPKEHNRNKGRKIRDSKVVGGLEGQKKGVCGGCESAAEWRERTSGVLWSER